MIAALNKIAWNTLDENEQTAISLKHGYDKSTWEAGEIMSRSHYKYLEIKARAEFFLKLFTEYIQIFNRIVPQPLDGDIDVIEYIILCIEKRHKPIESLEIINIRRQRKLNKTQLNTKIDNQLKKWQKSEDIYQTRTFNLVKEFDRWNNFRILPKHCQEPSAFKRRIKNVYKRQLKTLKKLNPLSIEHLRKLLETKRAPCYFLPLLVKDKPLIIKIKQKPTYLQILDDISLYYFDKPEKAEKYLTIITEYLYNPERSCQDGLNFWPKFRAQIFQAHNYNAISNKAPQRKYLQIAFNKMNNFL